MPSESKDPDKKNKDSSLDEKQKRMGRSVNPLKSHFGIDIGLPRPLWEIVKLIVWIFFTSIRLVAYTAVGVLVFMVSYGLTIGVYCPFYSNATLQGCLFTQVNTAAFIVPNFIFAITVVALALFIDYKIEWRKYI